MISTENQRRWWFATHPEFSWSRPGQGRFTQDEGDEETESVTPDAIDDYVDEALKYERDQNVIEILKSLKFWFGTEFDSKSPAEQYDLLWGDETPLSSDNGPEEESSNGQFSQQSSGHPAADRNTYDKYEDALDRLDAYDMELLEQARKQDLMGLEPDPHTALDVIPYRRFITSPIESVKDLFRNLARDAVLNDIKKQGTRWKVGDDHLAPTSKGVEPSWTTQARRYWKNEGSKEGAIDAWDSENVERMRKGLAPQRQNPDTGEWESRELHHTPVPRRDTGKEFIELWPVEHAEVDKYRRLKKR